MSSLVADYGNSSDSNSSLEELSERDGKVDDRSSAASSEIEKLPLPSFGKEGMVTNSVFKNPFAEEENAKSAILEKHVKMIPVKDDIKEINGKQICWMYRKGRCRFGHNCKFAHDSDLYSESSAEVPLEPESVSVSETVSGFKTDKPDISSEGDVSSVKKKKRPGLSQGLVPGKKVINMYKKQKLNNKKV